MGCKRPALKKVAEMQAGKSRAKQFIKATDMLASFATLVSVARQGENKLTG
jgi:hypothetical protein